MDAIVMKNVSKIYNRGSIRYKTLQNDIESWWAKKTGKTDPNSKIITYGNNDAFYALKDINLSIRQGERVGIIGNNGAGKSTLLRLLSCITAPSSGDIDIYGRVSSMLEVGTGFHREMTGRENIYMNGSILGMSKKEIDEEISKIIEFSEIGDFIDTPVKRYSSGMYVKLAFSVAAHLKSEILIMDEVLAVGDMSFQHKCLDKMRKTADTEGRTILYVSHNMDTIRKLCERVIVLNNGQIIYDGDPEEGISRYMNNNILDNELDIDLKNISRKRNDDVTMMRLRLIDKASNIYNNDEYLKLRLDIDSNKEYKDVKVRLTFRSITDVGIGTSWSNSFMINKGNNVVDLKLSLNKIMKGTLYGSIGIYYFDEIGRPIVLDHITRAFRIEIINNNAWNANAYGYIRLDDMYIEETNIK